MFSTTRSTVISRTSSTTALQLHRRTTVYSEAFFLPARSFSTPPTTTSKSKDASSPHTIAPSPTKAKVELRPGPIKPPITTSSSHSPKSKKVPTTNPSPQLQSTPSTATPSGTIAELMQEDLKKAYIHGVLARPPPNAGKVATLWHKAKELFVR